MSDYKFTKDWFQWAPDVWRQLIPHLPGRQRVLEIGSFEGRSSVWIVTHILQDGGELLCVDTWEGGEEHVAMGEDMESVEDRFHYNISEVRKLFPNRAVMSFKSTSTEAVAALHTIDKTNFKPFDFIYIDGSHIAKDVLTDACLCWPLLKKDGIMVFDDYLWGNPRDTIHRPKIAIDAFVNIFGEELSIVTIGYQFIVRKTK